MSQPIAANLRALHIEPRRPIADYVYEELIADLIDGRLEPGAPLSIDALARQYEISATPIREALTRLESTGLVERQAQRGYSVAPLLSPAEIGQLLDARLAIEPMNAYLACQRSEADDVARLRELVEALRLHKESGTKSGGYWEADEAFHEAIAARAGNPFLYRAHSALGGQVQRFRLFGDSAVTDAEHAIVEHGAIVDAIASGVPDEARAAMMRHLEGVKTRAVGDRVALETAS